MRVTTLGGNIMARMDQLQFIECTPAEFFARQEAAELCREYAAECGNPAFGMTAPDKAWYLGMGPAYVACMVMHGDECVGMCGFILHVLPHFQGSISASMESIFLRPEFRRGSNGLKLIRWALDTARARGARGLYLSAPAGSRLERLARHLWRHSNSAFFLPA